MGWENNDYGYGFDSMHNSVGHGLIMLLLSVLLVALVALLVFRALDRPRRGAQTSTSSSEPTPLEVLDMRLAKGKVSKDEYIATKELLEKKN